MAPYFVDFLVDFIDKAYKMVIIFTVYFVIQDGEPNVVKVCPDLVEAARFWGSFDQADFAVFRMGPGAEGFEFGDRGVSAWNHRLPDVDPAGLVFPEAVEGLVDDPGFGRVAVDDGEVGFMNFPALLHFSQKRSVLPPSRNQQEAGGFPVEPADEGEKLPGKLFPEPVDQREGSVRSRGMDQPASRFIDDQEPDVRVDDGGRLHPRSPVCFAHALGYKFFHDPARIGPDCRSDPENE